MKKPTKVTTAEQARALPEVEHPYLEEKLKTDPKTGVTTRERLVRPICPMPTDGDQILFFVDTDGRRMQIVYTPKGPAKCEFWW